MNSFCLEVVSGRFAGSTALLQPGDVCRVGSRAGSDLWLADDPDIEPIHCALAFDRASMRIHDLSQAGTYVNGARVTRSILRHGDWIAAGTSLIFVFQDGQPESELETVSAELAKLLPTWSEPCWYLGQIGDGPFERELLQEIGQDSIAELAPGLIAARLPQPWSRLQWFLRNVWGKSRGFFFSSPLPFDSVTGHFRAILAERPGARFHDPRVLRALVPEMPKNEVRELLGPAADSFLVESQLPSTAFLFGWKAYELKALQIRLSQARPLLPRQAEIIRLLSHGEQSEAIFRGLSARMGVHESQTASAWNRSHPYALSSTEATVQFAVLSAVLGDHVIAPEVRTLLSGTAGNTNELLDAYVARLNTRRG